MSKQPLPETGTVIHETIPKKKKAKHRKGKLKSWWYNLTHKKKKFTFIKVTATPDERDAMEKDLKALGLTKFYIFNMPVEIQEIEL